MAIELERFSYEWWVCSTKGITIPPGAEDEKLNGIVSYAQDMSGSLNEALIGMFAAAFLFYLALAKYDELRLYVIKRFRLVLLITLFGNIMVLFAFYRISCAQYLLVMDGARFLAPTVEVEGLVKAIAVVVNYGIFLAVMISVFDHFRDRKPKNSGEKQV